MRHPNLFQLRTQLCLMRLQCDLDVPVMKTVYHKYQYEIAGSIAKVSLRIRNFTFSLRWMTSDLAEILQDDGNVHVDDDKECNHQVCDQVEYGHSAAAAVPVGTNFGESIVAVWRIDHHTRQHTVPSR
jgi:hypothetical protein